MWKIQILIVNRDHLALAKKLREFKDEKKGIRDWRGKTSDGYARVSTRTYTVEINLRLAGEYCNDTMSAAFWGLQRVWDRYEQIGLDKPRSEVRCKVQWKNAGA